MATWFNQVYAYKWQIAINSVIHVRILTIKSCLLNSFRHCHNWQTFNASHSGILKISCLKLISRLDSAIFGKGGKEAGW